MTRTERVWTTEELDHIEEKVVKMTFSGAAMYLIMVENLNFIWAMEWLRFLAEKYPESRLAAHSKLASLI